MSERKLTHSTFSLERDYPAPPSKVFNAFADPATKARWFGGPPEIWRRIDTAMDFREGGHEHAEGQFGEGGPISRFDATYHEIVDDVRIVYDYEMRVNGIWLSVSLASLEFHPIESGTKFVITEQGVYFDDHDNSEQREEGTRGLLEALALVIDD